MIAAIVGAFAALIGGVLGIVATESNNEANQQAINATNASNQKIAEKTNKTNAAIAAQANQMQVEEAEKAYQRSTPTNQLRELLAAGYTEQQAKQIVGSSGSAATYSPVTPVTSTAVGSTDVAPTFNSLGDPATLASLFSTIGANFGSLGDDLTASDGGSIGKFAAQPLVRLCFEHLGEIPPESLTSIKSFTDWFNKYSYKDWIKSNYNKFEKVMSSPQAARAFMSQIKDFASSYSDTQKFISDEVKIKQMNLTYQIELLRKQLTEGEIQQQAIETEMMKYDLKIKPFEYKTAIMELTNRFEVANLDNSYLTNPVYKQRFLRNVLLNEKHRTLWLECQVLHDNLSKMTLEEQNKYLETHKEMFAIYGLFDEYGMTTTDVGSFIAAISASGIDLTKVVNDMVDVIVGDEEEGNAIEKLDKYIENNKANDAARSYERGEYDKVPGLTKKSGHKGAKLGRRVE